MLFDQSQSLYGSFERLMQQRAMEQQDMRRRMMQQRAMPQFTPGVLDPRSLPPQQSGGLQSLPGGISSQFGAGQSISNILSGASMGGGMPQGQPAQGQMAVPPQIMPPQIGGGLQDQMQAQQQAQDPYMIMAQNIIRKGAAPEGANPAQLAALYRQRGIDPTPHVRQYEQYQQSQQPQIARQTPQMQDRVRQFEQQLGMAQQNMQGGMMGQMQQPMQNQMQSDRVRQFQQQLGQQNAMRGQMQGGMMGQMQGGTMQNQMNPMQARRSQAAQKRANPATPLMAAAQPNNRPRLNAR